MAAGALAAALVLTACGADDGGGKVTGVQAVEGENCGAIQFSGSGEPDKLIVSDLPLQGDSAERSEQQNDAILRARSSRSPI